MAEEILSLGSERVIVKTADTCVEVESTIEDAGLADMLYADVVAGRQWCRDAFVDVTAADFMHALQLFAQRYNAEHNPAPFELDNVVAEAAGNLYQTHRLFAAWVMEVRVGLRSVWLAVRDLVAVSFATPVGGIPYTKCVVDMYQSYPTSVLHVGSQAKTRQQNVVFRGYKTSIDRGGDCYVGYDHGSIWLKNGWTMPGIRRLGELVEARTRSYVGKKQQQRQQEDMSVEDLSNDESEELVSYCAKIAFNVNNTRPAGIKEENFASAYGRRLDLENVSMMHTFLSLVRSLRAKVIYQQHADLVDCIAVESQYYKTDIIANPALAGDTEGDLRRYLHTCDTAAEQHHYVGGLSLPVPYAGFSPTTIPRALDGAQLTSLEGINEKCISMDQLCRRGDRSFLIRSPSLMKRVEDFNNIARQFGALYVFDKHIVEYVEEFRVGKDSYDSQQEAADAQNQQAVEEKQRIERYVAFRLAGEDNIRELTLKDFRSKAKFRLVPQVLEHRRGGAELDFFRDGIYVGLSAAHVNPKFVSCKQQSV